MFSAYAQATGVLLSKKDKTYIDVSLAFEPNPVNKDLTTLRDERAINNSLKNVVMTIPLEVPFNRNIGSKTTDILFDPVDEATAHLLTLEIERAIKFCEPRVETIDVVVEPDAAQLQFLVNINYTIVGSDKLFFVQQILTPTR